MEDQTAGIIIAILGICVAIMYQKYTKLQANYEMIDGPTVKKNIEIKDKYIRDLENEMDGYEKEREEWTQQRNSLQGKLNQKGTLPRYKSSKYDIEKNSDIKALVSNLVEDAASAFGPDAAEILKDPSIKERIVNYASEHPDQAKQFLSRFLQNPSNQEESHPIPGFGQGGKY